MPDSNFESYQKSLGKKVEDKWTKETAKLAKELEPIDKELEKLEANRQPTTDDKKKNAELKKKRDAIRKKIDTAAKALEKSLKEIAVPPQADEKLLKKLPSWLGDIVKNGGVPLGSGVTLKPNVGFDFKAKELKSFGLEVKWKF